MIWELLKVKLKHLDCTMVVGCSIGYIPPLTSILSERTLAKLTTQRTCQIKLAQRCFLSFQVVLHIELVIWCYKKGVKWFIAVPCLQSSNHYCVFTSAKWQHSYPGCWEEVESRDVVHFYSCQCSKLLLLYWPFENPLLVYKSCFTFWHLMQLIHGHGASTGLPFS